MNIFKQFIKSLHSPKEMATFHQQGIGKTILYIFFLVLITSIPFFISIGSGINYIYKATDSVIKSDIPNFTIENGEFSADVDEPVIINEEELIIIIDPNNEYSIEELENFGDVVAIQKFEVITIVDGVIDIYDLSQTEGFVLTKSGLQSIVDTVGSFVPLIIFIFSAIMYIFFSAGKFIQVTILALVGLILINSLKKQGLKYRHSWVLSAYAVTLPTVLFALLDLFHVYIPFSGIISFLTAFFILYLIMKEITVIEPDDKDKYAEY